MIFVNDVINHEEHKRMYLSRIEEYKKTHDSIMPIGYTALPSELEKVSKDHVVHSDFHIADKNHLDFFKELFTNTDMRNLLTKIGGDLHLNQFGEFTWMLESVWFQQYEKNGEHCWHNHPHCHFTNVIMDRCQLSALFYFFKIRLRIKKANIVSNGACQ